MSAGNLTTAAAGTVGGVGGTVRGLLAIAKLRIGVSIAFAALAGVFVAPGPVPPASVVMVLVLAVLVAACCAGAFNHYREVDIDARMARTRDRPFVTGAIPARGYWPWVFAATAMTAVAVAAWAANLVAALYVFLGAFFYAVVYTLWLKRRTAWNIVIGGAAGSFAVLAGAAATDPRPQLLPTLLALVLFFWTPTHFWSLAIALRADYAAAGVPMLPVVAGERRAAAAVLLNTLVLVALSLLPGWFGLGPVYLLAAALSGGYLLSRAAATVRHPGRDTAMAAFRASLIQLTVVLGAVIVDTQLFGAP